MSIHRARTRLPADWRLDAGTVDDRLDSLRRRWNQFGLEALVRAAGSAGGVTVRYRLRIADHPDPAEVHAAFVDDLDRLLTGMGRAPAAIAADWDLDALARAAEAAGRAGVGGGLTFEMDPDYDWSVDG